jgi:ElaB/YqjD/DUF883 family membrane-anchored ribosome-binding protein
MQSDEWKAQAQAAAEQSKTKINEKLKELDLPPLEEMQEVAKELADQTAAVIKKHPLASVFGALAVGFVLGSFWGKRK